MVVECDSPFEYAAVIFTRADKESIVMGEQALRDSVQMVRVALIEAVSPVVWVVEKPDGSHFVAHRYDRNATHLAHLYDFIVSVVLLADIFYRVERP